MNMNARTSLVTLALATLCLSGCSDPAADVPAAAVQTNTASVTVVVPTTPAKTATLYVIAPESTVGFVGSKVTGSHEGGFKKLKGAFAVVDGELSPEQHIKIDTTSLWADDDRLAGHLKGPDFFDTERFPDATFHSSSITKNGASHAITGNLTLHGVTKTITFPATVQIRDDQVQVNAEFSINRFDFDIKYPGKQDDLIREGVVIKLNIVARKSA